MRWRKAIMAAAVLLMGGGLFLTGKALVVPTKAHLSVYLLRNAWQQTLEGREDARPWPWMDATPAARLIFPHMGRDYIVLTGVSGTILAFAPGWHPETAPPGAPGITLISAHRDTHFTVLGQIGKGEPVMLEDKNGRLHHYTVTEQFVTDDPTLSLPQNPPDDLLLLVTCYPLDSWQQGGRQRYVVVAERTSGPMASKVVNRQ